MSGGYLVTAAARAGIAESGVRAWLRAAEDGDPRYSAIARLVHFAQASAEVSIVTDIRKAARKEQFWAAGMTLLGRTRPDRFGRRSEDSNTPRVVVQIGVRDGDVQVQSAAAAPAVELPAVQVPE